MFPFLFAHAADDLAIDLGTVNTCVFARNRGIVVNEPSILALNTASGDVEAVGTDASVMVGRTPPTITTVRPMRDGVIADFDAAGKMLTHFIRKANGGRGWRGPKVVIGVPAQITAVERRAVKDSARRARAREVHLIDEAMAAAIGAGMPVTQPGGNMIVDIGGGTTDIAVISLGGIVYSRSVRVAGNALDDAIVHHARKAHNLLIGERTAEQVKIQIGSAAPLSEPRATTVKGRHLTQGQPTTVTMNDAEIRTAIAEPVRIIVQAVRAALERVPPELIADVATRGVILTGGGALLKNLDERLRQATELPVCVCDDPMEAVALGAGRMLSDATLLRRVSVD